MLRKQIPLHSKCTNVKYMCKNFRKIKATNFLWVIYFKIFLYVCGIQRYAVIYLPTPTDSVPIFSLSFSMIQVSFQFYLKISSQHLFQLGVATWTNIASHWVMARSDVGFLHYTLKNEVAWLKSSPFPSYLQAEK